MIYNDNDSVILCDLGKVLLSVGQLIFLVRHFFVYEQVKQ